MGAKHQEKRVYNVDYNAAVMAVRSMDKSSLNIDLQSENPTPTGVWFRFLHGMSFKSYGEKITITLNRTANGTEVDILSECGMPTQFFDSGKNRQNVNNIFDFFGNALANAPQPAAQPQPAPQAPAVNGQFKFCSQCGTKASADSRFCASCGHRF